MPTLITSAIQYSIYSGICIGIHRNNTHSLAAYANVVNTALFTLARSSVVGRRLIEKFDQTRNPSISLPNNSIPGIPTYRVIIYLPDEITDHDFHGHPFRIVEANCAIPGIKGCSTANIPSWAWCLWDPNDRYIAQQIIEAANAHYMTYAREMDAYMASRPPFVELFHELRHCLRIIKGTIHNGFLNRPEEMATIGFGGIPPGGRARTNVVNAHLNENNLRLEFGLRQRRDHGSRLQPGRMGYS